LTLTVNAVTTKAVDGTGNGNGNGNGYGTSDDGSKSRTTVDGNGASASATASAKVDPYNGSGNGNGAYGSKTDAHPATYTGAASTVSGSPSFVIAAVVGVMMIMA